MCSGSVWAVPVWPAPNKACVLPGLCGLSSPGQKWGAGALCQGPQSSCKGTLRTQAQEWTDQRCSSHQEGHMHPWGQALPKCQQGRGRDEGVPGMFPQALPQTSELPAIQALEYVGHTPALTAAGFTTPRGGNSLCVPPQIPGPTWVVPPAHGGGLVRTSRHLPQRARPLRMRAQRGRPQVLRDSISMGSQESSNPDTENRGHQGQGWGGAGSRCFLGTGCQLGR